MCALTLVPSADVSNVRSRLRLPEFEPPNVSVETGAPGIGLDVQELLAVTEMDDGLNRQGMSASFSTFRNAFSSAVAIRTPPG